MPDHIERRRNLWYATLTIPADVRPKLGKFKFIQSLGTPDKQRAKILAAPILAAWRAAIRRERGETDAVIAEALRWREDIAQRDNIHSPEFDPEGTLKLFAGERAEEIEATKGEAVATRFFEIAVGKTTPTALHFDPWMANQAHLAQKTQDQMRKDVTLLVQRFPTLSEITHQAVKRWLDELTGRGTTPSSLARITSFCRSYWRHLQSIDVVPSDFHPFSNLAANLKEKRKATPKGSWKPFTSAEVVTLYNSARDAGETALANLIMLAAYSGARIEELCALKIEHVAQDHFRIVDAKTNAGVRDVPIHPNIKKLIGRLKKESSDGYLLSGLTLNKYGDRSNGLGKRFGRLKKALGFSQHQVFHSIRKTVVTILENAGVSENLAADIVGHSKPRITYGLYSGGANLKTKAAAVEKIYYPNWPKAGLSSKN